MNTIREYITDQLGPECFESREVFNLDLTFQDQTFDAVFDPYNERLKLFGISGKDLRRSGLAPLITGPKCVSGAYTKLTVYAYPGDKNIWYSLCFALEGSISGFFDDSSNAVIWAAYQDDEREKRPLQVEHSKIMENARSKPLIRPSLTKGYSCELVTDRDSTEISNLLRQTFEDYPTPISSRRIKELIRSEQSLFRCIRARDGKMVAVASAEIDHGRQNAELTDCATLPKEQRKGHMVYILSMLETDMKELYGITSVYSLTRAGETGINYTFAKLGYLYTGRLFNNCRMPDGWESMNIWCSQRQNNDFGEIDGIQTEL